MEMKVDIKLQYHCNLGLSLDDLDQLIMHCIIPLLTAIFGPTFFLGFVFLVVFFVTTSTLSVQQKTTGVETCPINHVALRNSYWYKVSFNGLSYVKSHINKS